MARSLTDWLWWTNWLLKLYFATLLWWVARPLQVPKYLFVCFIGITLSYWNILWVSPCHIETANNWKSPCLRAKWKWLLFRWSVFPTSIKLNSEVLWVSPDIITKPILIVHFTIDQSNILWLTDWLMVNQMIEWLTDWLTERWILWLNNNWMNHCVIVRLTDSLTGLLVDGLTFGLTNQLTNWCALFDWLNDWHV